MKYASIGSITHGTLRTEDLLDAFAQELEYQVSRQAKEWCNDEGRKERDELLELVGQAREIDPGHEDAAELVEELTAALERFAPAYAYFGAHTGDASDFGYWPDYDSVEMDREDGDLLSGEELPDNAPFGSLFLVVNERGNTSLYEMRHPHSATTLSQWVEVWSVV